MQFIPITIIIVKTIFGIGISSCHSIIGANVRDLQAWFDMKANNVENNRECALN